MVHPTRPIAAWGKLAPPRLGRVFDRQRLFAQLDGRAEHPGLWIGAAPGAGKSTLVATWLSRQSRPTLWLQLDASDADPATFVRSLDVLFARAKAPAADWPGFRADDVSDLAGWLRRRLRLYLAHLEPPWALVLDNHQELGAASPLQAALAQCLVELPRAAHIIFISREAPPPAYARALIGQQLTLLDPASLRFDADEALALARLHGHPDEAANALGAAQGWAGGMTLMLLGAAGTARLPGFDAQGHLFDYFASEVLARMQPAEQRALCMLAHLPSATGEMATALSGYARAPQLLARLAAQSLFTDQRQGPPTAYVFHALFSEFLRHRFRCRYGVEQVRQLQRRAGLLLAAAGQSDAGLQRLIDAECWQEAEQLLVEAAAGFIAQGRTDVLRQHIDRLPEAVRGRLAYWRGFSLLDADPARALAELEVAYAVSAAAQDADGELAAAAAAATALVSLGRTSELDRWVDVLNAQLVPAGALQHEDAEMRVVPGLLALVVYGVPWHPLAEALAGRAERLLHRESAPGQRLLLGALVFHLLWSGQLDRLERIVLRIDRLSAQKLAAPATMMRWWNVGILAKTLLGQHDAALADAQDALALVAAEPSAQPQRASAEMLRTIVALACCDAAAARQHLQQAALALHPDNPIDRSIYEHQRGMLALLEDDRATALRLMRAAAASASGGGYPMREHIALIANALAAAHCNEHGEAQRLLERVFAHPFHAVCRFHHWIAGIVAGYAAQRRGDTDESLRHLRTALGVARECGFRQGPMLFCCGSMMAQLMARALGEDIEPEVARQIVQRNRLLAPPGVGAHWPWPVRVFALGGLRVELNDRPLSSGRKQSRRLLQLLKVLAAHGDAPVPQRVVVDALWPEADGDAAHNALENALHRLRKLLGGDHRVLLQQGALALDRQSCWTDVGALERVLASIESASAGDLPMLVREVHRLWREPALADDELAVVAARGRTLQLRVNRSLEVASARTAVVAAVAPAATTLESLGNR